MRSGRLPNVERVTSALWDGGKSLKVLEAITGAIFSTSKAAENSVLVELSFWPVLVRDKLAEVTFKQVVDDARSARLRTALQGSVFSFRSRLAEDASSVCGVLPKLLNADEAAVRMIRWRDMARSACRDAVVCSFNSSWDLSQLQSELRTDELVDEFLHRWTLFARQNLLAREVSKAHPVDLSTCGLDGLAHLAKGNLEACVARSEAQDLPPYYSKLLTDLRTRTTYEGPVEPSLIGRAREQVTAARAELSNGLQTRIFKLRDWDFLLSGIPVVQARKRRPRKTVLYRSRKGSKKSKAG